MRAIHGTLAALTAVLLTSGTATAAGTNSAEEVRTGKGSGTAGATAEYNGRVIDLSKGWQGASICVEQTFDNFLCYDDEASYRAAEHLDSSLPSTGTRAYTDCPSGYFCLWDNANYNNGSFPRVQYRTLGTHNLASIGFTNRANSVYNNRSGWTVAADDTCSSETLWVETRISELSNWQRQYCSGSWNNKIDRVTLRS